MINKCDEDIIRTMYESDESDVDDGSDYDDYWFENHLKDFIFPYNMTLYFL